MNDSVEKSIVEKIRLAWEGVPYPGDSNIFTPLSYDDEDITDYFRGTTWEGHGVESLRGHSSAISTFFTPLAFHYWLPAYLVAAIEDPGELDTGLDSLISSLFPERDGSPSHEEQQERIALLTNEQKLAVIATLESIIHKWCSENKPMYDEKKALQYFYSIANRA